MKIVEKYLKSKMNEEKSDLYQYMFKLLKSKGKNKNMDGYKLNIDNKGGSIMWMNSHGDTIFATPFLDGAKGIKAGFREALEGYIDLGTFPFMITGDEASDMKAYIEAVRPIFTKSFGLVKRNQM